MCVVNICDERTQENSDAVDCGAIDRRQCVREWKIIYLGYSGTAVNIIIILFYVAR